MDPLLPQDEEEEEGSNYGDEGEVTSQVLRDKLQPNICGGAF